MRSVVWVFVAADTALAYRQQSGGTVPAHKLGVRCKLYRRQSRVIRPECDLRTAAVLAWATRSVVWGDRDAS